MPHNEKLVVRERLILKLRTSGPRRTYQAIGDTLGLSRSRIEQLEKRSIRKLLRLHDQVHRKRTTGEEAEEDDRDAPIPFAVAQLSFKELEVLACRFPLEPGAPHTYKVIGERLGMSGTHVREMEIFAVGKLMSVYMTDQDRGRLRQPGTRTKTTP